MLPIVRHLAVPHRTARTNLRTGAALVFVAGAAKAGGFLTRALSVAIAIDRAQRRLARLQGSA